MGVGKVEKVKVWLQRALGKSGMGSQSLAAVG